MKKRLIVIAASFCITIAVFLVACSKENDKTNEIVELKNIELAYTCSDTDIVNIFEKTEGMDMFRWSQQGASEFKSGSDKIDPYGYCEFGLNTLPPSKITKVTANSIEFIMDGKKYVFDNITSNPNELSLKAKVEDKEKSVNIYVKTPDANISNFTSNFNVGDVLYYGDDTDPQFMPVVQIWRLVYFITSLTATIAEEYCNTKSNNERLACVSKGCDYEWVFCGAKCINCP